MISEVVLGPEDDGAFLTGSTDIYVRAEDRPGWGRAGEQGLYHAAECRESWSGKSAAGSDVGLIKRERKLENIFDLPDKCWTHMANESRGC